MSISHHHTASGRPLRVAPAWVGGARPADAADHVLPVREAVWVWSVRRYARFALWALPASAVLQGWMTLGIEARVSPLLVALAATWLAMIAMIALAGLLAGTRTRRSALLGLLCGMAGFLLPAPTPEPGTMTLAYAASATVGAGWLLLGWAVFRSKLVNPADGVLLMLAAVALGAGAQAQQPIPTVGALLLLAAGTGLAWTGGRLIPRH
jgi:Amt family ammonium transporter